MDLYLEEWPELVDPLEELPESWEVIDDVFLVGGEIDDLERMD